jgi:hypothetical protein
MAESDIGEVRGGVVTFDGTPPPLPTGTRVRVEPIDMEAAVRDLSRRLLWFAGTLKGLPPDPAEQHDHFVHGTPKRTPCRPASPTRFSSSPSATPTIRPPLGLGGPRASRRRPNRDPTGDVRRDGGRL